MVWWVKDLALLKLWHRLQLQLRFDPWAREIPYAMGTAKKKKNPSVPSFSTEQVLPLSR